MKVNPGGIVSPKEAIGRDSLLTRLWKRLEKQSLILVAERRIGKTTILKKMEAEPKDNFHVLYRDLEHCTDTADFASRIASDIDTCLNLNQSMKSAFHKLWEEMGGVEVGGVLKLSKSQVQQYGDVLTRSFELLNDSLSATPEKFVVFAWDEFPLMLQKISVQDSDTHAMNLLDQLRAIRNTYPQIRLIFTGSIGLHHVISELKEQHYPNSPKNDMYTIDVPTLEKEHATELAKRLIIGEKLGQDPNNECAKAIAEKVDGFAFYVHHVIDAFFDQNLSPTTENVEKVIDEALNDAMDRWELRNYRERLEIYYKDHAAAAGMILDIIAHHPTTFEDLLEQARLKSENHLNQAGRDLLANGEEGLRKLLWRLLQDHYILRNKDGHYTFKFSLVRRWWNLK